MKTPQLITLYEFLEPDPVTPQLISHWKLDETSAANTFVEVGGEVVIEAENYSTLTPGSGSGACSSWNTTTANSPSGGTALIAEPNSGANMGLTTNGPRLDYPITFSTPGTYRGWVRMIGPSGNDDSVHVGLDGVCLTNASGWGLSPGATSWNWEDDVSSGSSNISFTIPAAGTYTFNVWMREDGTLIDKFVLNTSASQPSGSGPAESDTGGIAADEEGNYEPIALGANTWQSGNLTIMSLQSYLDGRLDDVRIYDQQLSAAQVAAVFTSGAAATSAGRRASARSARC